MPSIGDVKRGYELGIRTHALYLYDVCSVCGKPRWSAAVGTPPRHRFNICSVCSGKKSAKKMPNYRENGVIVNSKGRTFIRVDENHRFYDMVKPSNKKRNPAYLQRSRLVVAESLGRCLTSEELVHHIDGDVTNDSIENLQLCTPAEHAKIHKTGNIREHSSDEVPVKQKNGHISWYIHVSCVDCGKIRNVPKNNKSPRCQPCAAKLRKRK